MFSSRISIYKAFLLSIAAACLFCGLSGAVDEPDSRQNSDAVNGDNIQDKTTMIDIDDAHVKHQKFQESIQHAKHGVRDDRATKMQQYWKEAFRDIKNLAVNTTLASEKAKGTNLLNQWKLFLEDYQITTALPMNASDLEVKESPSPLTKPRFEGFASWERKLQQWADDLADYLEMVREEQGEYPFSTYGKPMPGQNLTTTELVEAEPGQNVTREKLRKVPPVKVVLPQLNETAARANLPKPAPAKPGEAVLPHTDIADKSKRILIVTTAALPWMTGTAVNPLLRAAYLLEGRKQAGGSVTLMLPWVERISDQERVYGKGRQFETPEEQEEYIRTWLRETAKMEEASKELNIRWYTAWQEKAENSLYSMGDITALVSADEVDICILEEPEHLNWYRAPGESWTAKFKHVVGIVHTNYFAYAQEQPAALIRAPAMKLLCAWMCRAHCHRLIKLSGTLGQFAPEKELVENVHGVRGRFLEVGAEVKNILLSREGATHPVFGPDAEPKVYFIGKMLWSKGLGSLMELLKYAEESADLKLKIDMYGGGPDKDAAAKRSQKMGLDMPFHGPIDHAELALTHKIFINPSLSEVLCTTVAEALAMGKYVILPSHPSNDFFAQFPNCLPYATKEEFVGNLYYALTHSPEPLSREYSYALTWKAATERLEAAGCIPVAEAESMAELLSSEDAGVDFTLPPLIEDEDRRKKIADTFRRSRERYRQFRSRLQQEIQQSRVLPKELQQKLLTELDKRLDLDIDAMLASPTLRLQLSPAELDKGLLDFYNTVSQNPITGDAIRVIGGGSSVGMQNRYMKQQARKLRRQQAQQGITPSILPVFSEMDRTEENDPRVTQWVKLALRRNLPSRNTSLAATTKEVSKLRAKDQSKTTKMSAGHASTTRHSFPLGIRPGSFVSRPPRLPKTSFLI